MKLVIISNVYMLVASFCLCENQSNSTLQNDSEEDQQMLKQSIQIFGPPRTPDIYNLPGPQLTKDLKNKKPLEAKFSSNNAENYSFMYYTKIKDFGYLERYEVGEFIGRGNKTVLTVRGQYSERFDRNKGGYYIRTVGYVADDSGYLPFLLDISILTTETVYTEVIVDRTGKPQKTAISTAVLITLTGGNVG